MKDAVFITLIVTGFTVAFLHAAIPTHWLPFVVAARAQRWNKSKTLAVTGVAGARTCSVYHRAWRARRMGG